MRIKINIISIIIVTLFINGCTTNNKNNEINSSNNSDKISSNSVNTTNETEEVDTINEIQPDIIVSGSLGSRSDSSRLSANEDNSALQANDNEDNLSIDREIYNNIGNDYLKHLQLIDIINYDADTNTDVFFKTLVDKDGKTNIYNVSNSHIISSYLYYIYEKSIKDKYESNLLTINSELELLEPNLINFNKFYQNYNSTLSIKEVYFMSYFEKKINLQYLNSIIEKNNLNENYSEFIRSFFENWYEKQKNIRESANPKLMDFHKSNFIIFNLSNSNNNRVCTLELPASLSFFSIYDGATDKYYEFYNKEKALNSNIFKFLPDLDTTVGNLQWYVNLFTRCV